MQVAAGDRGYDVASDYPVFPVDEINTPMSLAANAIFSDPVVASLVPGRRPGDLQRCAEETALQMRTASSRSFLSNQLLCTPLYTLAQRQCRKVRDHRKSL
jgi:hypothetical protein